MAGETEPDAGLVAKFAGEIPEGAMPVATLAVMWFLDGDGRDRFIAKFDGQQRLSITIGDLTMLVHKFQHDLLDQQ